MINPDLIGRLNADGVSRSKYFLDVDIPDDNIVFVQNTKSDANECFSRIHVSPKSKRYIFERTY